MVQYPREVRRTTTTLGSRTAVTPGTPWWVPPTTCANRTANGETAPLLVEVNESYPETKYTYRCFHYDPCDVQTD